NTGSGQRRDQRVVAEPHLAHIHVLLGNIPQIDAVIVCAPRLSIEYVTDRGRCIGLERLVLKMEFHGRTITFYVELLDILQELHTQITFTLVSGDRFLKISVTLILSASVAKELSRNTARSGWSLAI